MLSPNNRIVLLPQDREIMDITGMSEEQYRWFVRECYKNQKFRPGEPLAVLDPGTVILINLGISLLLSAAAYLLSPKPKDQEQAKTPQEETIEGQNVVRRDRFAPKSGFDSFQNVVDMGSVVPIIYTNRISILEDGDTQPTTYGGLRVNTNMVWSQILSVGGGQFFRGIFLIAEGPVNLETKQIALGNNTLASYELGRNQQAGRITTYFTDEGGRLTEDNYQRGVIPENDPGNFNDADIYEIDSKPDFCQSLQPSNQVEFGIYQHIGNNFGYKLGEPFVACTRWQPNDEDFQRQNDNQKIADARKGATLFHTRAGFTGFKDANGNNKTARSRVETVDKDWELTYSIYPSSVTDMKFEKDGGNYEATVNCKDIATSIASIQRRYDENINVGDLYRAGSAIVICTERSDPFVSEVDFDKADAVEVTAKFKVIEPGEVEIWRKGDVERDVNNEYDGASGTSRARLCSESSQLFRMLVASFSVERAFETLEVGLQSNVGLRSSGITNFNSLVAEDQHQGDSGVPSVDNSYQAYIDAEYCSGKESGDNAGDNAYRNDIRPGKYSAADTRYSFFRILYRDINQDEEFIATDNLYGVRSATGVDVYNYLRFKFTSSKRREFRFMPVSSWEIRKKKASGDLYALDAHDDAEISVIEKRDTVEEFTIQFRGQLITTNNANESERSTAFKLKAFLPAENEITNCDFVDIINRCDIENEGSGYSAVGGNERPELGLIIKTHQDVRVRSSANSGATVWLANVVIRAPINSPSNGWVAFVDIEGDPVVTGWADNDPCVFVSNSEAGGGSGFVGRVSVRQEEDPNSCETFRQVAQIGISPVEDTDSYVDRFARIAESFVYDSVTTTATEPEHKISYVNIISANSEADGPQYDNLALLGLNIRSSKELRALDQVSVYCEGGITDSDGNAIHLFPDVLKDLLTNQRYGTGEFFSEEQIDVDSFAAAAEWTYGRRYFFDGAISEKLNLRTWGAERARDFLLDMSVSGGQFKLEPTIRFDEPEPIAAMYSSGNIIEDTLQVNYLDTQDRLDPIVSVRWREERRDSSVDSKGLFPQIREFNVRRAGVSENAPVLQVDLSNFCTSRKHAEDRAKLECQSKRYITHAVTFKTVPSETGVQAGSIIKLGIETVYYQQPQNGAISSTGEVTSWPPLADGSYSVLLWDGKTMQETTLTVANGKAPSFKNSVFCLQDSTQKAQTYKVSSVSFDEDGNVDIEALYWPTNDQGISLMTVDWDNDAEWDIDG